ncbi:MAG: hypothetical protein IJQ34_04205 [Kiritimatiellae bacterium]|nr:hypothetical protein [Kiritimatiellia bacterium]
MSIELNIDRSNAKIANTVGESEFKGSGGTQNVASALFPGKSVNVASGAVTDLEALVERLKNEHEKAKFSLLLTSLNAIGQSLTDAEKRVLEKGVELAQTQEELSKELEKANAKLDADVAASAVLQAKIDSLTKQIEQAVADGKAHNELVKELEKVRAEQDAKDAAIADTTGKIAEIKNQISTTNTQIASLLKSIDVNTAKTIAKELSAIAEPDTAQRPAEAEKEAEKEEETNPFAAIRNSLSKIEREIAETIEENRTELV